MNQVHLRSDKGEYHPGDAVCGVVYLDIRTPTEAHGVQLSFSGQESVCCVPGVGGSKTDLKATHDYVDYCNVDLFTQTEPFALGKYCFPFRLQIPYVTPGSFRASGSDAENTWSGCVMYRLHATVLGTDALMAEQEVVIQAVSRESLRDNHMTQAHTLLVSSGGFFGKKVYLTVKPLYNYVRSGQCARLKMVLTNTLSARTCTFTIKLVRMLTLSIPYKPPPCLEGGGEAGEEGTSRQSSQLHVREVEGGPVVVRQIVGDLSQHGSVTLAKGGGLDNIMIPLKSMDGKSVMPSVQGKFIQCEYSVEVGLHQGDSKVQTVTCPLLGVLPVQNEQWLSWKAQQWMHTADVKLSGNPGSLSPPEELLESEAFSSLPGFQQV